MNYKLALKLFETGFKCKKWIWYEDEDKIKYWLPDPTLSELIEDIISDYNYLDGSLSLNDDSIVTDVETIKSFSAKAQINPKEERISGEETLLVAVAKLWLKLNEK